MRLPKDKRNIIPPENGWEERTYYEVEVSFSTGNPIHKAIFYSGFVNTRTGNPEGYNSIWLPTYERSYEITEAHYLKALQKLNFQNTRTN